MTAPTHPAAVAAWPRMNQAQREFWTERAAIREHEAGEARESAEAMALFETRAAWRAGRLGT
jgi:hypothetical protein